MEMARGGSASNQQNISSHETCTVSKEDYVKQLQAEIDRLTAESGKGSTYQRHHCQYQ